MARLEYFLVCESMSTDQETNRVSLFNILDDIQVALPDARPQQSLLITQLVAVSCWNHEPGDEEKEFQAVVRIHAPGQEEKDFPLNFKIVDQPRHRLSFRFQGIPKLEPGQLEFELLLNGKHVASHTVNVLAPKDGSVDASQD